MRKYIIYIYIEYNIYYINIEYIYSIWEYISYDILHIVSYTKTDHCKRPSGPIFASWDLRTQGFAVVFCGLKTTQNSPSDLTPSLNDSKIIPKVLGLKHKGPLIFSVNISVCLDYSSQSSAAYFCWALFLFFPGHLIKSLEINAILFLFYLWNMIINDLW